MARTLEVVILGKDKLSGVLGGIQGSLNKMGMGVAATGGAITAATVGIGALAMQAAPVESIAAAFEGLAESSGKSADEVLAALKEGSAGMVSQRDLMESYNMAAQLVSTTFANQLPQAMGYLTKVAAATGQDMDYMMNSLVVGVGRGSKMILDNLGITVDLEKAYEDWAKSLGISKDELTDEQKQAGLMNQVMTLLAKNTAAMPEITGTAAQSLGEMKASLADAKDEIGLAFLPVLQELIPIFRSFVDDVLPRIIPLIERFVDWFKQLSPPIQMVIIAIGPLLTILGGLMMALAPLIPTISAVIGAIISIGTPVGWIAGIIAGLIAIVALLAKAWSENWGGIQDKVRAVWENVIKPILDGIAGIFNWLISEVLPLLQAAFQTAWEFISEVITAAWEGFRPHLEELQGILRSFWEEMQPRLEEAWSAIKTAMEKVWEWVTNTLIPALQDLWDRLEPVREIVVKVAGVFGDFMGKAFITTLKVWLNAIIGLFDAMSSAIETVVGWIQTLIGWIEDAIEAWRRLTSTGIGGGGGVPTGGAPRLQAGLPYVPMTMPAILHPGEAVLTARQAARWREGERGGQTNIYVNAGGVYGWDGAEELIEGMIRERARFAR